MADLDLPAISTDSVSAREFYIKECEVIREQSERILKDSGAVEHLPANECGRKDTVLVYPEVVTRIIVPFKGFTGSYVWHCHLL